jgi:hypothetical protein
MELYPAEVKRIQSLIGAWLTHSEQELEASFGEGGQVNAATFLAIAQRLRAKGYESLPQDDRLSVLTPEKVRLSLQGLGVIQQYCKDDKLEGKPFTAMIKDRTSLESNVDIDEYDTRIKSRREVPLDETDPRVRDILKGWDMQKKAFRLIRRWTFKSKGIRIDMSIVRSTAVDSRKEYRWVRSFLEQNIFKAMPQYEVEVELLRTSDTNTPEKALSCLIRGVGEILRAIQKNTLLMRKSVKDKVLGTYSELNKSNLFRGVSPVTLETKNMVRDLEDKVPNIRSGYNVTDKADGLRALGYCDAKGELYLIDMAMNVYRTGLVSKECANSLVDGEWVTKSKEDTAINHFLIFDIYNAPGGENISILPFAILENRDQDSRYNKLQEWITEWNASQQVVLKEITELTKLRVSVKNYLFASPGHTEIFEACNRVLTTPRIYHTDGLILTPNITALPARQGDTFYEQFKWKPARDNTIDFLISYEKDPETIISDKITIGTHPDTDQTVRYKTIRLYVGAQKETGYDDPRATILNELPLPTGGKSKAAYQPILFNPVDYPDTMANICYRETEADPESGEFFAITEDSKEPIPDRCIVECRYVPMNSAGWRWVPMRIRHDKTERFLRGSVSRTLNSEKVGNSVWNSINNPVTEFMITTGSEEPSEEEMVMPLEGAAVGKKYYERKAQKEDLALVRGLRDFHNKWIKDIILYKSVMKGGNKKVLDLAVGKAGDLQRWRREGASLVVGVDTAGENIRDPANGAYRRYLDTLVQSGGKGVPQMIFVIGDSSKPLITGDAGVTPEEADILRAVFGQAQVQGTLPKAIEMSGAGAMRSGADVAVCMFALHYFFENKETLDGLLNNLKDCVKVGGYFAGCCFDGKLVFNMLRGKKKGESEIGKEGDVPIWSITKEYEADELLAEDDSVGLAIDVEFISIGTKHREYLVSFDYLVKRLKGIGFELLTDAEKKAVGLRESTNTFESSYKMAVAAKKNYTMSDTVKEFSFLNRWFIFKRAGEAAMPEMKGVEEAAAAAAAALATARGEDAMTRSVGGPSAAAEAAADVAASLAAPASAAAPAEPKTTYTAGEVVLIYTDAALQDRLKIGDPSYARWLAPTAMSSIHDPAEPDVEYPSVNHFIAAMKFKYASTKPEIGAKIAVNTFSNQGSIHQAILAKIRGKKLSEAAMHELLKEEAKAVADATTPAALRGFGVKFDEAAWSARKVEMWEEAYTQRWETDARFRKIVEKARELGKYLLYYVPAESSELGGKRTTDGKIVGGNLVGRIIMELAGFY